MPCKQALFGQGIFIVAGGVQHHFNNAFDIAISRKEAAGIYTKTPHISLETIDKVAAEVTVPLVMHGATGVAPGEEHTDMGWPITPDGLRALLVEVAERSKELSAEYGHVSRASVGAIQRRLLALEEEARASRRGLWALHEYRVFHAGQAGGAIGAFLGGGGDLGQYLGLAVGELPADRAVRSNGEVGEETDGVAVLIDALGAGGAAELNQRRAAAELNIK